MEPETTCVPLEISEGGTWNSFQPEVDQWAEPELDDPDGWSFWDDEEIGDEIVEE